MDWVALCRAISCQRNERTKTHRSCFAVKQFPSQGRRLPPSVPFTNTRATAGTARLKTKAKGCSQNRLPLDRTLPTLAALVPPGSIRWEHLAAASSVPTNEKEPFKQATVREKGLRSVFA